MIGRTISGRYEVQAVVGTGGMAFVYRAWDRRSGRMVAIKVLRPEYEQDHEFVRRFSREAEAAAKMSHENIVKVLDVGKDDKMRYIVMEYIDGLTLKEMIRQSGRIPPDQAVRMAIRTLAAVDHAHKNGIVHRDIKPQNILVDQQGTVKVADFGIARLKTAQTTRIDDKQNSALGSVHYFSPEQASGEVADEKSDLYSMGIVLYEMLTGEVPFDGDTAVSVALKHVSEEPRPLRELNPSISRALDEVAMRALAKDASKRYQTAAEFAGDLRRALTRPRGGFVDYPMTKEEQEKLREQKRRISVKRKRRVQWITRAAAIFVGLLLIGAVLWYFLAIHGIHTVPLVEGGEAQPALQALINEGFDPSVEYAYSEDIPAGCVIRQSVKGGSRRREGTDILLTVSAGSQWVYLDDMAGKALEDVRAALAALGIPEERVRIAHVASGLPPGHVAGQAPEAGWITRETDIVLEVSARTVNMPTLTSLTLEGAKALAEANGIVVGDVIEGYSADAAAGTVIAQSIAPEATVPMGSVVALTISQPREEVYYPASPYVLVVPLEREQVRLEITSPTGREFVGYEGTLDRGTHPIELSSTEGGLHAVREFLDGVLMAETKVLFE